MEASKTEGHILLLPHLAQGHIRPFLHLAHRLHSHTNFSITLLTTPLNAANIRRQTNYNYITIVELPFNSTDHGLPPNIENTDKLPRSSIIKHFHATTSLEPHLRNYLTHHHLHNPPICIIFDVFQCWANNVARSVGSTGICFCTSGAYGFAGYFSLWSYLTHRNVSSDEEEFSLPGFPEGWKLRRNQLHQDARIADGSDEWSKFIQPQFKASLNSSGWLCNSVEEVEPLGFQVLRNLAKLPIWGVGPLIMNSSSSNGDDDKDVIEWLDEFDKDSVLYICFGSQNTVTRAQMMELAKGLEESMVKFMWVIRPPIGFDINGEIRPEWLPEGFEERMREKRQGKLVRKWAPQIEILRHEATGGFLSHCGWNSVLEGLREGVPIIGLPLAGEQVYNVKMMVEEMGVAMQLTSDMNKEEVKRVVEIVLDRKQGSCGWEMKNKATQIGEKLRDAWKLEGDYKGSSVKAMEEFLEFIASARGNQLA